MCPADFLFWIEKALLFFFKTLLYNIPDRSLTDLIELKERYQTMQNPDFKKITEEARAAAQELISAAAYEPGDIFVVGCSTSEVTGHMIGSASSSDAARAIMDGILPLVREAGLFLAVQCCEHLNRAVVIESACAREYRLPRVNVIPAPHAGGAFAVEAMERFSEPVVVENINSLAALGMDIGDTFIGMHLRPVAVPIHTDKRSVGCAHLSMARTRPKYIGGERAVYAKL